MSATGQCGFVPKTAVFFGAFLLFLIQPLLGRTLLPLFGGSAAVWTVCLAAYQVLLLGGYAYAHALATRPFQVQRRIHFSALCAAVSWALIFAALRPMTQAFFGQSSIPALEVLLCVLVFTGLPYVMLAAGSTLVQAWLVHAPSCRSGIPARHTPAASRMCAQAPDTSGHSTNIYRLYAVSNLGSVLGLLAYPFALEPYVTLSTQWWGVAGGLVVYAGLMWCVARHTTDGATGRPYEVSSGAFPPSHVSPPSASLPRPRALWFFLPGVSAFLLNAAVAHLFTDVTPMPLVWVVMMAAFLLSYVVGFSRFSEVGRGAWCGLSWLALIGAAFANGKWGSGSFYPNAAASAAVLFFAGVVLHGWLYAERPATACLTRYYLAVAAGGAAGGLLSSLVAPVVCNRVWEYPLALCACAVLVTWRMPLPNKGARRPTRRFFFSLCCGAVWGLIAMLTARHTSSRTLFRGRNFYGTLRVTQTFEQFGGEQPLPVHYLWCGQTTHGLQVRSPLFTGRGTSYYGSTGGGIAFTSHPKYRAGQGVKVGVVGLGAGCLACYGREVDLFRFYEINPLMVQVACDPLLFTFLRDAPMPIDLVRGDARRMLEKEAAAGDPRYDLLLIDAYSGDAVPYHLATEEAFRLYFDRLEVDGILAVHVSNWHIDLLPLCKTVATALGVYPYGVVGVAENQVTTDAMWVFMTRRPMTYQFPRQSSVREVAWEKIRDVPTPTDEKGSLLSLLR